MKLLEASLKADAPADGPAAAEVPSLAQLCEAVVIRNLPRYTDVSPLSVTDLVNIILKARVERDPALVLSFEQTQPGLADDELLDEQYWKPVVERMYPSRKILAPFEVSKADVAAMVQDLSSDNTSRLLTTLSSLRKIAISVPLLSETGVGKAVKALGKHENSMVATNAKTITAHWRAIIDRVLGKEVAVPEGMTEVEFNDAVKQAERAPQVHTWRQLFLTCKQIEDEKLERFGKRSREQAQELQAGKRRVQEAAETLNARPQKLLASASSASSAFSAPSSTSSSSSSSSQAAGSSGPTSVRAKYLRELGHDRAKELAKRTKLIPATRPVPPNLKSTASHRVLKTSSGAVMKIPRAFDPARRPR